METLNYRYLFALLILHMFNDCKKNLFNAINVKIMKNNVS